MCFTNKGVVIIGAGSGIGAATALAFAKLNASLCIVDINEKNLLKVKKECEVCTKAKVVEVVADLTKDKDVERIGVNALKELGNINVLVNCAGVAGTGSLQDADIVEKVDNLLSINLRATITMTKQVLPALIESKGAIINISSVTSTIIMPDMLSYSITKAGVASFTKCAAFELADRGVRVNCISPGPVRTNIWLNAGKSEAEQSALWDSMAKAMPLKRCVRAEEIAELVVFLATDKAASITGSDFVVDAGMLLGKVANIRSASDPL